MTVDPGLFLKPCLRCGHYFHDIEELGDPVPTCCNEDCMCGKTPEDKKIRDDHFNNEEMA